MRKHCQLCILTVLSHRVVPSASLQDCQAQANPAEQQPDEDHAAHGRPVSSLTTDLVHPSFVQVVVAEARSVAMIHDILIKHRSSM